MLDFIGDLIRGADAPREQDSERDGVLSYAVEYHSLAIGAAVGFAAVTTGNYQLAGGLIALALGANRGRARVSDHVAFQIRKEPWYFFAGGGLGLAVGLLTGGTLPI